MQNPDIWSDKDKVSKIGQEIKEKKEILEKLNSWTQTLDDSEASIELQDKELIETSYKDIKNLEREYEYQVEIDYQYSEKLFLGIMKHLDEIDATITNSLVNYTIDRLSYVDRAIIRNAIYEMKYEMLPKNIVIDEALLITREYSNLENDAQVKFNNRLLDNIAKNIYD